MMRRSLVAVLFAAASCGGGEECRPASLVRIDEARRCGLPIAEVPGLSFCHPAGQDRTKGVRPICVYDGHTRYVGYIATDEHIPGGTFSECATLPMAALPPPFGDGGCPP
jgi:hypothetical protein